MATFEKILADLERHRRLFDLTRDGLGGKLCKAATDGVQECLANEHDPDGARWADLSDRYEEWKSFTYPGRGISLLHGTMDDPREVAGTVEVRPGEAEVTYGVSADAKQEASWFQEGDPPRQPPRPFWGFTREATDAARMLLDDRFEEV